MTKNINLEIGMYPQTRKVLLHLEARGSISPMEALNTYGIYRLSSAIHRLRNAGYEIETEMRQDQSGKKYSRYHLNATKATPAPQKSPLRKFGEFLMGGSLNHQAA